MTHNLPPISSLDLFDRQRGSGVGADRSPPPSLFQFPTELLPSSSFRHPYVTSSRSDPLLGGKKALSDASANMSPNPSYASSYPSSNTSSNAYTSRKRPPSTNSGAVNQRNHVKAKNQHSSILVECIELLHQRCDPRTTPPLPPNWHERNMRSVKDKVGAVKDLYLSLTGEPWEEGD